MGSTVIVKALRWFMAPQATKAFALVGFIFHPIYLKRRWFCSTLEYSQVMRSHLGGYMKSAKRRSQRGIVTILYALMILGIVGFAGVSVDVGYMEYKKRCLQAAADAAAMGALRELELGQTDLVAAGLNDASLNGFTNGTNNTTVSINNPPSSGSLTSNFSAVEAVVTTRAPSFFSMVFGNNGTVLMARAVARTSTSAGSVGGCIFAMDPTASGAFTINGTVVLTTACGAIVNSNSASAFTMVGNSSVNLVSGAQVGVVGPGGAGQGWSMSGQAQLINSTTNQPQPPVNIRSFADPLANVPVPTAAGMTVQGSDGITISPSATTTLNPGIFCGGINVKGTANFNPGTYVLAGGGLRINAQAVVNGQNVLFYNTTGSFSPSCGSRDAGPFFFNGGASINLSAQGSQSPVGVLFFDDRTVTGLSHIINGNSNSTFDGAMYHLKASLKFAGTNQTPGFLYIVANTIELTGTSNLGNDHSNLTSVSVMAPTSTGGGLVE